jgi:multicomponent Na+:H+ antiporter subunit G
MHSHHAIADWILATLLVSGGFFLFVASLGILRLPDVMTRMHASTKAGTLGAGLIFVAVAVHVGDMVTVSLSALTVVFLLVTAPVAAHAIGRAAYRMRVPLWENTHLDEWKGHYAPKGRHGADDASRNCTTAETRAGH